MHRTIGTFTHRLLFLLPRPPARNHAGSPRALHRWMHLQRQMDNCNCRFNMRGGPLSCHFFVVAQIRVIDLPWFPGATRLAGCRLLLQSCFPRLCISIVWRRATHFHTCAVSSVHRLLAVLGMRTMRLIRALAACLVES